MMTQVIKPYVDDAYFDLVPRPTKEQRKALKESMQNEGQLEPIIVDSTGRILDGHTRFEICQELHLKPKFIVKDFSDEESKKNYAITVNLKRRHLNDYQIFELLQKEFKKIQEKTEQERRQRISDIHSGKEVPMIKREWQRSKSIKILSRVSGIKVQTLEQCKFISENADSKTQEQVRSGVIKPRDAFLKLRKSPRITIHSGKPYRSKLGIVYDILRIIKTATGDVRPTYLGRMANLSFHEQTRLVGVMLSQGIIKEVKETRKHVNYDRSRFEVRKIVMTDKGDELYSRFLKLYEYLPKEFQNT